MTSKNRKKPQLDQLDFEAMKALREQRGWNLYCSRLRSMLESKLRELERDADHDKTITTRAEIRTLRAIIAIPDILLTEAQAGAEQQRESED